MLNTNTDSEVALSGSHPIPPGALQIYISKVAFDSLIKATLKETDNIKVNAQPIVMTVEELEELAEGFATAFDEEAEIKISASVDKIFATQFDSDFGNVPFKAELTINFTNPIEEKFLAA